MQDKQKVTVYLPQSVHRQLKIRAAVDEESMSTLVERAIGFYLKYPEKIEEIEDAAYGKTHQVHICPECEAAMVLREGEMVSLKQQPGVVLEEMPLEIPDTVKGSNETPEKTLVTC